MNKFNPLKKLPVWLSVSAVIILAGILLWGILGLDYGAERPTQKTVEVNYNVVAEISEEEGTLYPEILEEICGKAFGDHKLHPTGTYTDESGWDTKTLRYTFSGRTADSALNEAVAAIEAEIDTRLSANPVAEFHVSTHVLENEPFTFAAWRGGVALGVGAVLALIYIGIRFGIAAALTGAVNCAHDVLFTLGFVAITRIPLYAASPLVLGAVAAFSSLLLWMLFCSKMRANAKDPAYLAMSTYERVEAAWKDSFKLILIVAGALAATLLIVGVIAAPGVRTFVLPALIGVAAALYSSLLFGPALHVFVKAPFDRMAVKKKRYTGKKKAEKTESAAAAE